MRLLSGITPSPLELGRPLQSHHQGRRVHEDEAGGEAEDGGRAAKLLHPAARDEGTDLKYYLQCRGRTHGRQDGR